MSSLTEDSYLHCSLFDDTEAELIDIFSNQSYEPKEGRNAQQSCMFEITVS